jgi:hypothetical protein
VAIAEVEERRSELTALCERFAVASLEIFGSATTSDFEPSRSDLDFLVQFLPEAGKRKSECFFGLLFGLEDLFGRKIDLLERPAIKNQYLILWINEQREQLYAA